MKKNTTKLVWIIVILVLAGLIFWRTGGDFSFGNSLPSSLTAELGKAQTYKADDNNFTFSYPEKLKVTETPLEGIEGGKIILVESGEKGKGFEVTVLPFDEAGPLTKARILQDLPDFVIEGEKETTVGSGIKALSFNSQNEDIGLTSEIWFVNKGFIYQARTYRDFGVAMGEILKTWRFK